MELSYQEFKPIQKQLKWSDMRSSAVNRQEWKKWQQAGLIYFDFACYNAPEMVGLTSFGHRVHNQSSLEEAIKMHRAQVDKQLIWLRAEDFKNYQRILAEIQNPYNNIMRNYNANSEYSHEWDMSLNGLPELND